jgi:hypothetical protein
MPNQVDLHADSSLLQVSLKSFSFSLTVIQLPFPTFASLFHEKRDLLKARVVIYAYQHVRLLSPEPLVVKQPQSTRVEEPTLLCNHLPYYYSTCPVSLSGI